MIGELSGIAQLWNDNLPQTKKIHICCLFHLSKSMLIFFFLTICFYHPAGCGMPTFSSEAVIGGEAAKVLSPQPKRGHRWPINQ